MVSNNSVFNILYGTGIYVTSVFNAPAASSITNNDAYYVTYGIVANGNTGNGTITVSGNDLHNERFYGIQANDFTLVTNNTVHDNPTGIDAANIRSNTVYSNETGIYLHSTGTAQDNRVYNNSRVGINTSGGTVRSNTIYTNNVGLVLYYGTVVTNNLIYDNYNDGIVVDGSGGRIENNTIYQHGSGDAIQLGGPHPELLFTIFPATGTAITNNILHVEQGYAMNFAADSGSGSTIDYNNLHVVGSGQLAHWQNRDFTDLADWFYELGFDQHSQTLDPQLIDPAGADGILGFATTPIGSPIVIDNGDPGFSTYGSWDLVQQSDGTSGDFLENATSTPSTTQTAVATWLFTGGSGYSTLVDVPVTAFWAAHAGLGTATYSHSTSATWMVTYSDGLGGQYTLPASKNFSGIVATMDQSLGGTGSHNLATLHLDFPDYSAVPNFISASGINLTTTLTVSSARISSPMRPLCTPPPWTMAVQISASKDTTGFRPAATATITFGLRATIAGPRPGNSPA